MSLRKHSLAVRPWAQAAKLGSMAAAACLLAATGAQAGAAVYTISSTLNGTFNGARFTNEGFTFTVTGNTNNIINHSDGYEDLATVQSETVTLDGIGTFTVLDPASLGTITTIGETALDEYEPETRNVFLWETVTSVDLYDSFGPIGSKPFIEVIGDVIPTSGGDLQFDNVEGSGNIIFAGSVVPEPATVAMLLLGAPLLAARRRRV